MANRRAVPEYTDEDKNKFCELAQEIGVARAQRQLGYPVSSMTGIKWLRARGVEYKVNKTMAEVRAYHTYYQTEDLIMAMDNAMSVIDEMLVTVETADDMKKLSDALYKIVTTKNLLEGKATAINEKRERNAIDEEILSLIDVEKNRNAKLKENKTAE